MMTILFIIHSIKGSMGDMNNIVLIKFMRRRNPFLLTHRDESYKLVFIAVNLAVLGFVAIV